jgi:hypothetical protein
MLCQSRLVNTSLSDINVASVDGLLNVLGALAVNGASNGDAGSENLLDSADEMGSVRLGAHLLGDFEDGIHGDLSVVDNVLGLLSVPRGLLEGSKDEGTSGVEHSNFTLLVLDLDLNLNLDTLPVLGGLLDILTDLLGGHTDRGALGGKSSSGGNLSSNNFHEDEVDLIGVESSFRGHSILFVPIY